MALADILERIADDTAAEVQAIEHEAAQRVDALHADAHARSEAFRVETLAAAEKAARREAERIVVGARLNVRDSDVAARRRLIDEALGLVAEQLAGLDDAAYAAFLGSRVAAVARGGERLAVGAADAGRAQVILAAAQSAAPGLSVELAVEPAPFERGALVLGDRTRADLSLAAIVEERRDDLELVIAKKLFGEGE